MVVKPVVVVVVVVVLIVVVVVVVVDVDVVVNVDLLYCHGGLWDRRVKQRLLICIPIIGLIWRVGRNVIVCVGVRVFFLRNYVLWNRGRRGGRW